MKQLPPHFVSGRFRLFFLLALMGVILFASLAVGGEAMESVSVVSGISHQEEEQPHDVNESEVIFEEPLVNGAAKDESVVSQGAKVCLEPPAEQKILPRVAIIIDDMGHHKTMGNELLDLELNLTFSFLPFAPFTQQQVQRAWEKKRDILLHMPMEATDPSFNPGPGTLHATDSDAELTQRVEENIDEVPHAIGVNNHMGSKFTTDRRGMHEVMAVLKRKNLFFVDSLTTSKSVGVDEARNMGIQTGRRSVFLDNVHTQEDICRQLKRLVAHAQKYGSAIGIGHPNRATINALKNCREMLKKQVRIVGVHELIK